MQELDLANQLFKIGWDNQWDSGLGDLSPKSGSPHLGVTEDDFARFKRYQKIQRVEEISYLLLVLTTRSKIED